MEFVKSFNIDYGRVLHYWSVNTWSWRIYIVVAVLAVVATLGSAVSWVYDKPDVFNYSSKPDKFDYSSILSKILSILAVVNFAALLFVSAYIDKNNPYDYVNECAMPVVHKSSLDHGQRHYFKVDWDIKKLSNSLYQLDSIKTTWPGDKRTIAVINANVKTGKVIFKSKSKLGRAYLKTAQYIDKNTKHPVDLKWSVKPYMVRAKYDSENGPHDIVCFVDNKVIKMGVKQTVVKY